MIIHKIATTYIITSFCYGFYKSTLTKNNNLNDHILYGIWHTNPFYYIMNKEINKNTKKNNNKKD